jgi:uncharacterized membrane protein YgcG
MKYLLRIAACVLILMPYGAFAAETITNFAANYTINNDASVSVVETITYDFGEEERHGIYRLLENTHPQPATAWHKQRFVEIADVSVTRDGQAEPFTDSWVSGAREIRIGDEDETIIGEHTYVISYVLYGALSYGSEGTEFYWNATGNGWEVPIRTVMVRVMGESVTNQARCYQGVRGSIGACTTQEVTPKLASFTADTLDIGEGLTIATALDGTSLPVVIREELKSYLSFALALLWLFGLGVFLWRYRQQEDPGNPIIAQYEPFRNYLPMYTGVLLDNNLDSRDVTAGILYLAEQGFLTIRRTDNKVMWIFTTTDYEFVLRREVAEITVPSLKVLVTDLLFRTDCTIGSVTKLSELAKNSTKNYTLIQTMRKAASAELRHDGFLATDSYTELLKYLVPTLVVSALLFFVGGVIIAAIVLVLSLSMLVLALSNRRSKDGYEALNHIQGFKLFLSVTDKERFDFHNAPEKNPELFMKYLPYAVALGVEEKWAKVFKDITIPQPQWFEGAGTHAFSAAALTSDISSFSSALSSTSGVSGSSGGGSSGGGGGGGGGGSW